VGTKRSAKHLKKVNLLSSMRPPIHSSALFTVGALFISLLSAASTQPQLPGQAMSIAKQCKSYTGTVCSGVIDYNYFGKEKDDGEETVRAALKKVEVHISFRCASDPISLNRFVLLFAEQNVRVPRGSQAFLLREQFHKVPSAAEE